VFVYSGRLTLLTGRDLSLVFQLVQYFREAAGPVGPVPLERAAAGLASPASAADDRYIQVLAWGSSPAKARVDLVDTRQLDEVLDGLCTVDVAQLRFATPRELIAQLTKYGGPFIDVSQRLRLEAQPDALLDQAAAARTLETNAGRLREADAALAAALFDVSARFAAERAQIARAQALLIARVVLPALVEHSPKLAPTAKDLDAADVARLRREFDACAPQLQLPGDAEAALRRALFAQFIDRADAYIRGFAKTALKRHRRLLGAYFQAHGAVARRGPRARQEEIRAAAAPFREISGELPLTAAIQLIAQTMVPVQGFDDAAVAIAMALSGNPHIITIRMSLSHCLIRSQELLESILSPEQALLIRRFHQVAQLLQPPAAPFIAGP
jgi:hypothetical protein